MEELLVTAIGGIGVLFVSALAEGIGEALGELFGAVAEAGGEALAAVGGAIAGAGGEAVAEAGGEAVAAIGESGTDAGAAAPLGAVAGEPGDTGEELNGGAGRIGRFMAVNAAVNHASNRSSSDSFEPAPATLSYRERQELNMFENGVNPHLW